MPLHSADHLYSVNVISSVHSRVYQCAGWMDEEGHVLFHNLSLVHTVVLPNFKHTVKRNPVDKPSNYNVGQDCITIFSPHAHSIEMHVLPRPGSIIFLIHLYLLES